MLATTVLLLLSATPTFLNDAPRRIQLVDDEPARSLGADYNYDGWTRSQLNAEYDRLDLIRPGIGLPIALTAAGGGALAFSALMLVTSLSSFGTPIAIVIFFAITAVIGGGVGTLGGILLYRAVPERRAIGLQMDEVERRFRGLRRTNDEEQPTQPQPPDPYAPDQDRPPAGPPEPYIPPPQVLRPIVVPITLAVF